MANYEKTMAASTETLNYNIDPELVKSFLKSFKILSGSVSLISIATLHAKMAMPDLQ